MTLNLEQHRGEPSVWDMPRTEWDTERWLAAIVGGACLMAGFRRRSLTGLLLAFGGSGLAWWAAAGSDERNRRRGQVQARLPRRARSTDAVTEAAEESFPASDAPAWTPTTGSSECAREDRG